MTKKLSADEKDYRAAMKSFTKSEKELKNKLEANRKPSDKLLKEIQDLYQKIQHMHRTDPQRAVLAKKLKDVEYKYDEIRADNYHISTEIAKLERYRHEY
jgi:hypothetical protein